MVAVRRLDPVAERVTFPPSSTRPRMSRKSFSIFTAPTSVPSLMSLQAERLACFTHQNVSVFAPTAARTPPAKSCRRWARRVPPEPGRCVWSRKDRGAWKKAPGAVKEHRDRSIEGGGFVNQELTEFNKHWIANFVACPYRVYLIRTRRRTRRACRPSTTACRARSRTRPRTSCAPSSTSSSRASGSYHCMRAAVRRVIHLRRDVERGLAGGDRETFGVARGRRSARPSRRRCRAQRGESDLAIATSASRCAGGRALIDAERGPDPLSARRRRSRAC